ncbi:hypothetical protein [Natronomonas marina]|uniref:hypothetical protein n=1 Tax=Natronomonas marina TaxID=2961939 RepID=UPI0020C96E3B|nr:hypothetical protein [Natronomonas marina]
MDATRRRTLRALGASAVAATAAGCLSGDGQEVPTEDGDGTGTDDGNGTDDGDGPDTDADGVTVDAVSVRPELVTRNSPDSYGTYGGRNEQYVVVELSVESPEAHPPDSFAVEAGDETHGVVTDVGEGNGFLAEFDTAYDPEDGDSGWLAARLPKPLEAESAALTWDGGRHEFDDPVLERLRRPPAEFQVGFEAPESAAIGDTVTATVTAENVGDVDGTFVGALNRVGPLVAYAPEAAVVLDVEAGDSATWEFTHELDESLDDREDPRMRLHLVWDEQRTTREVDVERP